MASIRFDLPEPLGPISTFSELREIVSAESPKLKKLFNLMEFINMASLARGRVIFFTQTNKTFL
jgi:hypothetical protein